MLRVTQEHAEYNYCTVILGLKYEQEPNQISGMLVDKKNLVTFPPLIKM